MKLVLLGKLTRNIKVMEHIDTFVQDFLKQEINV
jgi:hypothetical protein